MDKIFCFDIDTDADPEEARISSEAFHWIGVINPIDGVPPTAEQCLEFVQWIAQSAQHRQIFAATFAFDCYVLALASSLAPEHQQEFDDVLEPLFARLRRKIN